jgi:hypothetical protein
VPVIEVLGGHDQRISVANADLTRDRGAGQRVVTGDDDHADPGPVTPRDRARHPRPRRVEHDARQPGQHQVQHIHGRAVYMCRCARSCVISSISPAA